MKSDATFDEKLYDLPIDQFSRQSWVSNFINEFRGKDQTFAIVDVGGFKGKTAEFQTKDKVIICDLFDVKDKNYVRGDGRKLPFADDEFDFVVSFDTYEHVPRAGRKNFVKELCRVAKVGVILAAPFDDEGGNVARAEINLNQYHKDFYKKDHRWLKEHIEYKIPKRTEIESILQEQKVGFVAMPSNELGVWELVQSIYFSIILDEDLRGRVDDINRYYNRHLADIDIPHGELAYRHIYFMSSNKRALDTIENYVAKVGKNHNQVRSEFIALALSIFGKKYRDVVNYKDYLEKELRQARDEVGNLQNENLRLQELAGKHTHAKLKQRVNRLRHRSS